MVRQGQGLRGIDWAPGLGGGGGAGAVANKSMANLNKSKHNSLTRSKTSKVISLRDKSRTVQK
jgi:hypothetical protein